MKIAFNYPIELLVLDDGEEFYPTIAANSVWDCVWETPLLQRLGNHELRYRGHVNIETAGGLIFMRVPIESYRYIENHVEVGKEGHA